MPPTLRLRKLNVNARVRPVNPPPEAYTIPELLGEIASYLDWPTLMALAQTEAYATRIAQSEVRGRIRLLLAPFISQDKYEEFFDLLSRTNGSIIGSFARCLITHNSDTIRELRLDQPEYTWPFDLNIAVRPRFRKEWVNWLNTAGFHSWCRESPAPVYQDTVHYLESSRKPSLARNQTWTCDGVSGMRFSRKRYGHL